MLQTALARLPWHYGGGLNALRVEAMRKRSTTKPLPVLLRGSNSRSALWLKKKQKKAFQGSGGLGACPQLFSSLTSFRSNPPKNNENPNPPPCEQLDRSMLVLSV